jgi:hypothetical protein
MRLSLTNSMHCLTPHIASTTSDKINAVISIISTVQVYDVYMHIMPSPKPINVLHEADPPAKLIEYLKAVKYKPPTDAASFRYALANCDRDTLHGILKWTLSQSQVLQQRAMIGYYLAMPDVPAEFKTIQVLCYCTPQ